MTSRIHIQHVLLSLEPGGLENGVVNVVNRLNRDRFRSSVCCLKHAGGFACRLPPQVSVHEMALRSGNDPLMPLKLALLFRRTRPDIVHTRNPEAFFYGMLGAKIAGVPAVVHSEHGRTFLDRPLRFRVQRILSGYVDAIFAVSEQLKRDLASHVGIAADRIGVLHNGVDLARFAPADRDAVRARLGIAPGTILIGSVGRLAKVKDYPCLLRAVAALGVEDVEVMLVGDGPERGALEDLSRTPALRGRVRMLGHRDDISALLGAMDVFVLPSISEGMSNTLLEAMAAGVAIVASNVGGTPEIVRDGVDGLLFESGDEFALRESLHRLMADALLRARFGQTGRERVLANFSIEAMISRYEALYQSVLGRTSRPGALA